MSSLAHEFSVVFREEHRSVRDLLLGLVDAFTSHDRARARSLLEETAAATGPHFRYEEEALYPSLSDIFGHAYVEHLYEEHDGAIERARMLVHLTEAETLSDDDASTAVRLTREILPHVSDCDGLSVMVEVLPDANVEAILAARRRSRANGLGLFEWADTIRGQWRFSARASSSHDAQHP